MYIYFKHKLLTLCIFQIVFIIINQEKTEIKKNLGEALKEHRVACKMTQEFVAERIGVSRQAVSKWESGISNPSTSNLIALAKLFGTSVEALLAEVNNQKKTN